MGYKEVKDQTGVEKGYIKYQFYVRVRGKQYRRIETCRRSAVNAIYRDWEDSILSGVTKQYRFFQIVSEYLEYIKSVKSERMCLHEITVMELAKEFFGNMELAEFRRKDAEDFILWRKNYVLATSGNIRDKTRISPATLNRNISVLSYFFNWCIRREYYRMNNPFSMTKVQERNYREVSFSREEIDVILSTAHQVSPMLCKVVLIALLTGMRRGEIFSLEWDEVDLEQNRIILSEQKTKGKRSRAVPISPALKEVLLSLERPGRYVVRDLYTMDQLKHQWTRLIEKLSFGQFSDGTKFRFHDIRHLTAQTLLNQGLDIVDVQHILGHRDSVTTQRRYSQFARPDLMEKGTRIDNILPFRKII